MQNSRHKPVFPKWPKPDTKAMCNSALSYSDTSIHKDWGAKQKPKQTKVSGNYNHFNCNSVWSVVPEYLLNCKNNTKYGKTLRFVKGRCWIHKPLLYIFLFSMHFFMFEIFDKFKRPKWLFKMQVIYKYRLYNPLKIFSSPQKWSNNGLLFYSSLSLSLFLSFSLLHIYTLPIYSLF